MVKKFFVDSGIWGTSITSLKNTIFENDRQRIMAEVVWHEISEKAENGEIALAYNEIVEKELLDCKRKDGRTVTKSEISLADARKIGTRLTKVGKLNREQEIIINSIRGKDKDKQILRDALAANCNGIITYNKKDFISKELEKIGFEIIDLTDFENSNNIKFISEFKSKNPIFGEILYPNS